MRTQSSISGLFACAHSEGKIHSWAPRDSIHVQRGAGAVLTFLHLHILSACISNEAESLIVAQREAKHSHLSVWQSEFIRVSCGRGREGGL